MEKGTAYRRGEDAGQMEAAADEADARKESGGRGKRRPRWLEAVQTCAMRGKKE